MPSVRALCCGYRSNRTFMELKSKFGSVVFESVSGSNRTFMELKSARRGTRFEFLNGSNRTFMELKLRFRLTVMR